MLCEEVRAVAEDGRSLGSQERVDGAQDTERSDREFVQTASFWPHAVTLPRSLMAGPMLAEYGSAHAMGTVERFLSVWVALAIATGVGLGLVS